MINRILHNCEKQAERNAFCIQTQFYTYAEFKSRINHVFTKLDKLNLKKHAPEGIIGLLVHDDLDTYASIIAIWAKGYAYLPVKHTNPIERNQYILESTGIKLILNSKSDLNTNTYLADSTILKTYEPEKEICELKKVDYNPEGLAYIFFTSGSTGVPKGVPVSYGNLHAFLDNFIHAGFQVDWEDRFLQIYDLTFDASVHCFALPLYVGGCVYTVPANEIKYLYAYKLMRDYALTFVKMPPSTISYLQPYFKSIRLPKLKYCLFGGEALVAELVEKWRGCIPKAEIYNVYGPTEATINCTSYKIPNEIIPQKTYHGIVSIGKTFGDFRALVIDDNLNPLPAGEMGELCVTGKQVVKSYWKAKELDKKAFIHKNEKVYYRTGDLVVQDADGDLLYAGRKDNQVQINGFRVELGEIEYQARSILPDNRNIAVLYFQMEEGNLLVLFIEGKETDLDMLSLLADKLPDYMVPDKVVYVYEFPKSPGGKINTKALKERLNN